MPSLQPTRSLDNGAALGHVNLMVDTFIANAHVDDLRSAVRNHLVMGPPATAASFTIAARAALRQNHRSHPLAPPLFLRRPSDGVIVPSAQLTETLARARSLFGAGMGFASLGILASIVRATIGHRWKPDSEMEDVLAIVDADICQALQSSREELDAGRLSETPAALESMADIQSAVESSFEDTQAWGGEFPFERAASSLKYWTS